VPEHDIVEHNSDSCNANNGEDDNELTPPLGRGPTAGGGDDDGDTSSSSSDDSRSGSTVHCQRRIHIPKKEQEAQETDRSW